MSLARFAVDNATSRAVFNKRNFSCTVSRGSKGSLTRASSTKVKSQGGTRDLAAGLSEDKLSTQWIDSSEPLVLAMYRK